ncbi:MAG: PEGA domain-containing protein, partial [Myxococcota bacterium]
MSRAWISGWAVAAALGALTLGVSPSAQAEAGSLDIRGWLDRPGVKLLAVEFYATWCEPCMAAVPRWKELHERYRQQGLRLVVVATQDPEGGCVNPGWNPDDVICDDEGQLARMMGAGDRLPAAFLWSWQGNLLVRKGHVEEVEKGIEEWMKASPRVDVRVQGVAEGSGVGRAELRDLVRNEIGRSAKLTVVASEEERKRLDAVRRRSFAERFDDDSRCELGKELSPNSLLDVKVYGSGSRKRLRLGLLSLERGCLVGSAVVDWNRRRPEIAVAEAVAELVQKLRPSIQMPRGRDLAHASGPSSFEEDIGERVEAWEPEAGGSRVIVSFRSEPPGVVLLDGNLLCQDTSRGCSRALAKGSYTVTMQRERYKKRIERLRVEAPTELDWALEPNFGTYAVRSDPSDLEVEIDGVSKGRTPLEGVELAPGRHEILVTDPCFYRRGKRISAKAGERRELAFEMKPRLGALDIVAVDRSGNAQRGEAWIDGVRVGAVPAVHKAPVCARTLEIKRANGTVAYRGPLAVKEKQLIHVRATVDGAEDAREADRGRVLVYMNDGDVDTRVVPQAEGTALIESVRASRKVTTFTRFDRVAARLSDHGAVVVPELESGRPELSSADAGALRAFVRKGGVMVTVLDDPKKARSLGLLEDIFGWRLRSDGSPKGSRAARTTEARRLGLAGPPSLPLNNDTDVLLATSLPEGAVPLYVDEDDRSVVTMLPFGKGHVAVLGWDWYDAKPRGRVDGGWLNVLRGLLDARVEEA